MPPLSVEALVSLLISLRPMKRSQVLSFPRNQPLIHYGFPFVLVLPQGNCIFIKQTREKRKRQKSIGTRGEDRVQFAHARLHGLGKGRKSTLQKRERLAQFSHFSTQGGDIAEFISANASQLQGRFLHIGGTQITHLAVLFLILTPLFFQLESFQGVIAHRLFVAKRIKQHILPRILVRRGQILRQAQHTLPISGNTKSDLNSRSLLKEVQTPRYRNGRLWSRIPTITHEDRTFGSIIGTALRTTRTLRPGVQA